MVRAKRGCPCGGELALVIRSSKGLPAELSEARPLLDLASCMELTSVRGRPVLTALGERCYTCRGVESHLSFENLQLPLDAYEPWSDVRGDLLAQVPRTKEHAC